MEALHPAKSGDGVGDEWLGRNRYDVPTVVGAVSHAGWSKLKECRYRTAEIKCAFHV